MMKVKYYTCPECGKKYKTLNGWGDHMTSLHPNSIPEGYSISRFFYYVKTGKTHGVCRTCKKDTPWNENSMKYDFYCENPECKKAHAKIAKERMLRVYGKEHLLDDPEVQKKMLKNRSISGIVRFDNGEPFDYVGSLEKKFLEMMRDLLNWHPNDLIAPSPNIYYYDYKNPNDDPSHWGKKFYIPDFYIPSLNLEIEIKQQTSGNEASNLINRVKEKCKDDVMKKNPQVRYIKINDNDFTGFFQLLMRLQEENVSGDSEYAMESVLGIDDYCIVDNHVIDRIITDHFALETSMNQFFKSKIRDNYAPKGYLTLDSFKKVNVTKSFLKKHKTKMSGMYGESSKKREYICTAWLDDKNDVVATLGIEYNHDDGHNWITSLEVTPNYQKYGLGEQVLRYAISIGADALGVYRTNEVAIHMYEKCGFVISDESREEVSKNKKAHYRMYLKKPAIEATLGKYGYKGWHYISNKHDITHEIDEDLTCKTLNDALLGYIKQQEDNGKRYEINEKERVYHYTFNPNSDRPNKPIYTGSLDLYFPHNDAHEFDYEWAELADNIEEAEKETPVEESYMIATEGLLSFFGIGKDKESIINQKIQSWKEYLGISNLIGKNQSKGKFTGIRIRNGNIEIWGIKYSLLQSRITRFYGDQSIFHIFTPKYNALSYKRFEKKKIQRKNILIDYMYTPTFFALELVRLFEELGKRFKDKTYRAMAAAIYSNTWLSDADQNTNTTPYLETSRLKNICLELNSYQIDFIKKYPKLKAQLNLNGYILAFEQGLGKTLTAIGLSECLNVDHVYIVCPNSLKENWALEIKKYYTKYQEDSDLFKSEVFICSDKSIYFNEHTTKYIITNNESISKMMPYVMSGKNMLILDESHNFRNIEAKRSQELLQLKDTLKCSDVLVMSGTPIKATPNELVPALALIDPTFTEEAQEVFQKAFKLKESMGTSLVRARFGKVMWRKRKDVLENKLPEKHIDEIRYLIENKNKYIFSNVMSVVFERYAEIYEEGKSQMLTFRKPFFELADRFVDRKRYDVDRFHKLVAQIVRFDYEPMHEIDLMYVENYLKDAKAHMSSNEDRKQMDFLISNYLRYPGHCKGLALGEILPKYRRSMFEELYIENSRDIHDRIKNNVKKTLIFSQFKGVANTIYNDLNDSGIGAVIITGDVTNRMEILEEFKENNNIQVLVATSQTLGTGVTLTEANQMFFFGPPWRSADFEQCCDRIHRIGQTDDVYIYTVILDTGADLNLSTRMDNILKWSKQMTDATILDSKDSDDINNTHFEKLLNASEAYTEFLDIPDEHPLNVYEELDHVDDYINIEKFFRGCKITAKKNIPIHSMLDKYAVDSPIGSSGKFKDMKFSDFGSYMFGCMNKDRQAPVKFVHNEEYGREYWSIVTTRDIKVGEELFFNPKDDFPSFSDPERF